jgi:bifunctional DNA-binding transcriptional regulator/antitoxin component of YhaV-PrlF toxin-antitoxin module
MALAISKVTAQGKISVPKDVRRKLGIDGRYSLNKSSVGAPWLS